MLLALALTACTGGATPSNLVDAASQRPDTDSDWLCDETELRAGTDPQSADSDGDRLPDGVEVQYGLDPLDDADPGATGIVFLRATPGSMSELQLHVVVDGAGESFSGELDAWPGLDASWATAEQYFATAVATSAEPPDHVFGFPANGDRIGSVVGETRLGFRLRFVFGRDVAAVCPEVVPFGYAIKRQDGVRFGDRHYTLVVAPDIDTISWCPAETCL
jgi:hypothetical protein